MQKTVQTFFSKVVISGIWLTTGLIALLFLPQAVDAATYYVSTSGNDANNGSSGSPWRTIQKAANTAVGGDVVIVAPGNYNEKIQVSRSGSAGKHIEFRAQNQAVTGADWNLIAENQRSINQGFTITGSYVRVVGFAITNKLDHSTNGHGIYISGSNNEISHNYIYELFWEGMWLSSNSSNNQIRNNSIFRARMAGLHIEGTNNLVEGNRIRDTRQYPPNAPYSARGADADGIRFFGSGHLITKNKISDIVLDGVFNTNAHIDCFQSWGPVQNVIIDGNECDNPNSTHQGFQMRAQPSSSKFENIIIRNNIIKAWKIIQFHDVRGITVVNNTFIGHNTSGSIAFINCNSQNITVKNNILYNFQKHYFEPGDNECTKSGNKVKDFEANMLYRVGGQAVSDLLPTDRVINPMFVDVNNGNYKLSQGSPAIDSGVSLSGIVPHDFDGLARPYNGKYDIGAHEYGGVGGPAPQPTATPTQVVVPTSTPTPTRVPTATPTRIPTATPTQVVAAPTATQVPGQMCAVSTEDWNVNYGFSPMDKQFIARFSATPLESGMDTVIGLSNGPATWYDDLAAIVRFSPAGVVDVRDGSVYRANMNYPYQGGRRYDIKFEVDVVAKRYSVYISQDGQPEQVLAQNYNFRTTQASVARLNNWSMMSLTPKFVRLCSFEVVPTESTCNKTAGDADCNGRIDQSDFLIWQMEYKSKTVVHADFDGNGRVNLRDFEIWRRNSKR